MKEVRIMNKINSEEIKNKKKQVDKIPIYHKQNLTIQEATEYSNIGIHRLNLLVSDPSCTFVLHVGAKRLIKRELFDEFIKNANYV